MDFLPRKDASNIPRTYCENNAIVRWIQKLYDNVSTEFYTCEDDDVAVADPNFCMIVARCNGTPIIVCTTESTKKAQHLVHILMRSCTHSSDLDKHLQAWIVNKSVRKALVKGCEEDDISFEIVSNVPHFVDNV